MDRYGETQGCYIWRPLNKGTHEGSIVWQCTKWGWTVHSAVTEVRSYHFETTKAWNTRRKLKSYLRVSANSGHVCQSNCTFWCHTWTIFQRTMEIWVNSRMSTFAKTFTLWKLFHLLLVLETGCGDYWA